MTRRSPLIIALLAFILAVAVAPTASASPRMMKGIYDEPETLYGNPDRAFPILERLGTQMIRVNLYWGGRWGASKRRPTRGVDPDEPGAFDWQIYDRLVLYAQQHGIRVLFSIYGTPAWANGGKGLNVPPKRFKDLETFAYLAARRYGGRYVNNDGTFVPAVRHWLAWNEPNNPLFLKTQYRRVGGRWIVQSAKDYAQICNAIVRGVSRADISWSVTGQRVACGATAPRGNNNPRSSRASVAPIAFLRGVKAFGGKGFDAWAHHPYYASPANEPGKAAPNRSTPSSNAVTLGNINTLIAELTRGYGRKPLWITEYGYQTNPPDRIFGVSSSLQAKYLTQAFAIARKNPRIDLMLWFLLKDEPGVHRWQSGLMTRAGKIKPSFSAFQRVPASPAARLTRRP